MWVYSLQNREKNGALLVMHILIVNIIFHLGATHFNTFHFVSTINTVT